LTLCAGCVILFDLGKIPVFFLVYGLDRGRDLAGKPPLIQPEQWMIRPESISTPVVK
jgi:hypothetical protein